MAKARTEITISHLVDIVAITRYYLLQSSTASAPAKPTAKPPGGSWVTTEPTYTEGSTNTLYTVELTEFTNNTFKYSAVSKSSSYEAAKAAYNKAVSLETSIEQNKEAITLRATKTEVSTAKTEAITAAATDATTKANNAKSGAISSAATDATTKANNALTNAKTYTDAQIKVSADSITSTVSTTYATKTALSATDTKAANAATAAGTANNAINNLEVGGRNLLLKSNIESTNNEYGICQHIPSEYLVENDTYSISVCITPGAGLKYITLYLSRGWFANIVLYITKTGKQVVSGSFAAKYYAGMTPADDPANGIVTLYRFPNDGTVTSNSTVHWIKIEKGNKSTDWTPAPEDVDGSIGEAKQAANDASDKANKANQNVDKINSSIVSMSSQVEQLATTVTTTFTSTDERLKKFEAWIRQGVETGNIPYLELGQSNASFTSRLTSKELAFYEGAIKAAYVSNQMFNAPTMNVGNTLKIGPYSLIPSNGHLTITYTG